MKPRFLLLPALFAALWIAPRAAFAVEPHPPPAERPASMPSRRSAEIMGLVGSGVSTASLLGVSSTAIHIDAGIGIERDRLFVPIFLDAELGRTQAGISTGEVTLGVGAQRIVERFRLGGGFDVGYGWIGRAPSSSQSPIGMYALDAFALATADLFHTVKDRAIFLGIKPSLGLRWGESFFAWGHGTVVWRGTAMIGIRF